MRLYAVADKPAPAIPPDCRRRYTGRARGRCRDATKGPCCLVQSLQQSNCEESNSVHRLERKRLAARLRQSNRPGAGVCQFVCATNPALFVYRCQPKQYSVWTCQCLKAVSRPIKPTRRLRRLRSACLDRRPPGLASVQSCKNLSIQQASCTCRAV